MPKHRSFLAGLFVITLLMAVGLAVLLAAFLRQAESVERTARLQGDSITQLTFQMEREFLRLRTELALGLARPSGEQWEQVTLRYDIFLSRLNLMRDNPSTAMLAERPEYRQLVPMLESLMERAAPMMDNPGAHTSGLAGLLSEMNSLGPDVQELSFAVNRQISSQIESQVAIVQNQNRLITILIGLLTLALILTALQLAWRQKRLDKEQTALERLNTALHTAKIQAESANLAKSQFLANMSHELRTPFNGMLGMMTMVADGPLTAGQRDQLQTAQESARHLLSLLNDLLDMSALEAEKLTLSPTATDPAQLLREVIALMQPSARNKGLSLTLHPAPQAPATVLADSKRVRQVLFNLLSNAIKFTEQGCIDVHVRCETQGTRAHWTIQVQDSGIGIPADTLPRLFQRFAQADSSTSRRFGGTGLGLEISRSLARLMGGDLYATSTVGVGSEFTFEWWSDICAAEAATAAEIVTPERVLTTTPPPQQARPSPAPAVPDSGLAILVAEDHPVNRKFVGTLLERMGHRVTFATTGHEALAAVQERPFDLVLMDIHMPEMDGLTSTRLIRQLPGERGQLPILALTADVMQGSEERALAAGVNEFLTKPIQREHLEAALQRWAPSAVLGG